MVIKTSLLKTLFKKIAVISVLTLLIDLGGVKAQKLSNSTRVALLSTINKQRQSAKNLQATNAVFPEILKGNETETLGYIEKFSERRRSYLVRMYIKGKKLLPKAATIFKKYDLPAELRILLTLESAYNGNAISKAGAVGYWQIMDEVAQEYGMKYVARLSKAKKNKLLKTKNKRVVAKTKRLVDDRKNFNVATHTAARYLRDRKKNLDGNWLLVVASYNCGVGNVWNAMKRSKKDNPTFWDIKKYLPAETQAYVMNFVALNVIFHNYELFAKNKLNFTPIKASLQQQNEINTTVEIEEPVQASFK